MVQKQVSELQEEVTWYEQQRLMHWEASEAGSQSTSLITISKGQAATKPTQSTGRPTHESSYSGPQTPSPILTPRAVQAPAPKKPATPSHTVATHAAAQQKQQAAAKQDKQTAAEAALPQHQQAAVSEQNMQSAAQPDETASVPRHSAVQCTPQTEHGQAFAEADEGHEATEQHINKQLPVGTTDQERNRKHLPVSIQLHHSQHAESNAVPDSSASSQYAAEQQHSPSDSSRQEASAVVPVLCRKIGHTLYEIQGVLQTCQQPDSPAAMPAVQETLAQDKLTHQQAVAGAQPCSASSDRNAAWQHAAVQSLPRTPALCMMPPTSSQQSITAHVSMPGSSTVSVSEPASTLPQSAAHAERVEPEPASTTSVQPYQGSPSAHHLTPQQKTCSVSAAEEEQQKTGLSCTMMMRC